MANSKIMKPYSYVIISYSADTNANGQAFIPNTSQYIPICVLNGQALSVYASVNWDKNIMLTFPNGLNRHVDGSIFCLRRDFG